MLAALSIRNIVLIDQLDLEFGAGLSALTGETGAGKSILLDSFGLALGARGDARLVREGCDKGQVTALFELPDNHAAFQWLKDNDIDAENPLVLRRVQMVDGRTRAFVNDIPVSIGLLRKTGQLLVEIHGQHDDRALVDKAAHRVLLDAHGGLLSEAGEVAECYKVVSDARKALESHRADIENIRERAGYLAHVLEDLRALSPAPDEEEQLAGRRQMMMSAEKIARDLRDAESSLSERGGLKGLASTLRKLERQPAGAGAILQPVTEAIEKVLLEVNEAQTVIFEATRKCAFQPRDLEQTEERLFALREAARKYKVPVSELNNLADRVGRELATLDANEARLQELQDELQSAVRAFGEKAGALSVKRETAAKRLDRQLNAELPPLKLEKAQFITRLSRDEEKPGPHGFDSAEFHVQTNPGSKPGPMLQVASGGEQSRFILALKVVLAGRKEPEGGGVPVLIFDEIDKGVGGATATAIGERLARLAADLQVFTVTHAPQIAALAHKQMRISKDISGANGREQTTTSVKALSDRERREEIARMLAGSRVTKEARAAADRLLGSKA